MTVVRSATHPATPAIAILAGALALVAVNVVSAVPVTLAWVVVALSAGYAVSGSV